MTLQQKIKSTTPKKILTLDGGGIRGMISVEILGKIEALLRKEYKNDLCTRQKIQHLTDSP